ncbi:MAG: hypothetical protein Q7S21_04585 [archaeon]|nr:hypothetical protein [archaeon]
MFDKKAQSALEYLMTYGWALVVIVIVIAALVFLINPTQVGPNNCTGFSRFPISNHQVNASKAAGSDEIILVMSNQTGGDATSVDFNATGRVGSVAVNDGNTFGTFAANDQIMLVILTANDLVSGNYDIALGLTYTDRDGIQRTDSASCKGTI